MVTGWPQSCISLFCTSGCACDVRARVRRQLEWSRHGEHRSCWGLTWSSTMYGSEAIEASWCFFLQAHSAAGMCLEQRY